MKAIIVLRETLQAAIAELVAAGLRHNTAVGIVSNVVSDFYQSGLLASDAPVVVSGTGNTAENEPAADSGKKPRSKKSEAAEAPTPTKAEDKPEPAPKSEPAPAATQEPKEGAAAAAGGEAEDDGAISFDEVKAIVGELAQSGQRDALVALFGEFGAKRATELKPEQYADFLKKANSLLPLV